MLQSGMQTEHPIRLQFSQEWEPAFYRQILMPVQKWQNWPSNNLPVNTISQTRYLGYGIPDFEKADKYLKVNSATYLNWKSSWAVSPNPFADYPFYSEI